MRAVREYGGRGARCGLSDNCETVIPVTETPADVAAAHEWFEEANQSILGPIYDGRYSEAFLRKCGTARPKVERGDLALIGLPTDFLGLNIYAGLFVRRGADGQARSCSSLRPATRGRTARGCTSRRAPSTGRRASSPPSTA